MAQRMGRNNEMATKRHYACHFVGKPFQHLFKKHCSWLYDRLNGVDQNANPVAFTDEEKAQLKDALTDLADRIRRAADNIQ